MTKHRDTFDQPSLFSGRCSSCGEEYQASSKQDDLEGITFSCKQIKCGGRVTLEFAMPKPMNFKKDRSSQKPHRVC